MHRPYATGSMRRWLALALATALLGTPARAIVLVDRALDDPEAQGWHGEASFTLSGLRGNSARDTTHLEGLLGYAHGTHAEFLIGELVRGRSRGVLDQDRAFVHLRHRTRLGPAWAWEAFAQQERDPFARIRRRRLAGGGLVRTLWHPDDAGRADLGVGAFAEEERTTARRTSRLWRANLYLRLRLEAGAGWQARAILYWQPRPDRTADARALGKAELRWKPDAGPWHLKLAGSWRYDARPPAGAKRTDARYRLMLGASF